MKNQPKMNLRKLVMCVFIVCPLFTNAAILYVNPAAVGASNGTSWADAFTTLSRALLVATSGDEIWVKQGVYKPVTRVDFNGSGGFDPREATFQIPNGVAVYGGFAGTEMAREERNWETNLTILSGDIDNNDLNLDGNFIAATTAYVVGNNAYHVLYTVNVNTSTLVDGFIVTAGRAEFAGLIKDQNQDGGGWYNRLSGVTNASSPTIRNNIFQGNYAASEGGAFYCTNGTVGGAVLSLIENCKFAGNTSNVGGAIKIGSFSAGNYQPHIVNCNFSFNRAYHRGGAIYFVGDHALIESTSIRNNAVYAASPDASTLSGSGGGVSIVGSNATFTNCLFEGNSSTGNPAGAFEGGGGGALHITTNEPQTLALGTSEPKFIGCGFYHNVADNHTDRNIPSWGGAINHVNDAGILRPTYINCVFWGNDAQNDGGAVSNFTRVISPPDGFTPGLSPAFTNCTFARNNAGQRGGAIFLAGFVSLGSEILQSKIENSILWNNTAGVSGQEVSSTGSNLISYSIVKGSGGSGGGWNTSVGSDGGNNLDTDPGFVNEINAPGPDNIAATNDDGLISTSSALNAGNNAASGLTGITTDYISGPRIMGGTVDMGAYETQGLIIPKFNIYWLKNWPVNPGCLNCPWSFLLADRTLQQFVWDGPAQLIDEGESAFIKGHIVNLTNTKIGFDVVIKLVNKQDWKSWSANGGTYTTFTWEASETAKKTHTEWTFWELSGESYLKGTGEFSGELKLSAVPSNDNVEFQLGEGANGWDKDLGMSGSFSYLGQIEQNGKEVTLSGTGSMNVDADLCTNDCVFEEFSLIDQAEAVTPENVFDINRISIFPVPAKNQLTILSETLPDGNYSVKLFNNKGALKKQATMDTANGNLVLAIDELESGVYVLKLISSLGETWSKKLIIE